MRHERLCRLLETVTQAGMSASTLSPPLPIPTRISTLFMIDRSGHCSIITEHETSVAPGPTVTRYIGLALRNPTLSESGGGPPSSHAFDPPDQQGGSTEHQCGWLRGPLRTPPECPPSATTRRTASRSPCADAIATSRGIKDWPQPFDGDAALRPPSSIGSCATASSSTSTRAATDSVASSRPSDQRGTCSQQSRSLIRQSKPIGLGCNQLE